jgi:hypothetical protein
MAPFYTVNGATDAAIREACGGPQRNLLKRVEGMGHKVTTAKVAGPKGRKVNAYRIQLKKWTALDNRATGSDLHFHSLNEKAIYI